MIDPIKPDWVPIALACKQCKHEWDDWSPYMVPANTLIAHWKTYRCPQCRAGMEAILIRPTKSGVAAPEEPDALPSSGS